MDIRFHNTLTHKTEAFAPVEPPHVYMYNCGPTVYDFAHIGNFRAFVFADVLRRFLELTGHDVHQVMNLTDVGHMTDDQNADGGGQDKMQLAATRLKEAKKSGKVASGDAAGGVALQNPDDPYEVAEFYIAAFLEDARKLNLKIAFDPAGEPSPKLKVAIPKNMPRATQHVGRMMKIILKLVEHGHAYVAPDGAVYYAVESFPQYGQLSGNTLDKLRGGAGGRIDEKHQANKRHPADFLLWKPDPRHIMKWESPWGEGYPGWHIECSAMAAEVLGREVIDIHTGGEDNIFPHHECEIAQSCGASGKPTFARHWMHTRFLLVEGEKMSKSKGNFFTVRDLLAKGVDPAVIRFELLKAHYRSNMNFTMQGLKDSASAVQRLRDLEQRLRAQDSSTPPDVPLTHPTLAGFAESLADDLNMSKALATVFSWASGEHKDASESRGVLAKIDSVLGVISDESVVPARARLHATTTAIATARVIDAVATKCLALDAARKAKDFAAADRIRKELQDAGYEVMTTKAGTTARKKLA